MTIFNRMNSGFVYLLTNHNRTSLYIGVTSDLERRILEHKAGIGSKHTSKYKLKYLLYFEEASNILRAIAREKQLKNWHKEWKWNLIREGNPELKDLAADWFDQKDIDSVLTGKSWLLK